MAGKRRDSRWVAHLQLAIRAIPAGFVAAERPDGEAGAPSSVVVSSMAGEVTGKGVRRKEGETGRGFRERENRGEEREAKGKTEKNNKNINCFM